MSFEETQRIFAGIIEKPQLTAQLLARPPFKFILDIVSNVIKSTGYLEKEFSSEELQNASVDKNSKTLFLEKLIKTLDDGSLNNVKAAKIISGKDAEETNKMLQKLGANATSHMESSKSSKKVKSNGEANSQDKKVKKEKRNGDASKVEKPKKVKKTTEDSKEEKKTTRSSSKERHKSGEPKTKEKKKKLTEESLKTTEELEQTEEPSSKPKKSSKKKPSSRVLQRADSMIAINGDALDTASNDLENPQDEGYDDVEEQNISPPQLESNTTHVSSPPARNDDNESPRMINQEDRTSFIRPAPPKIKKKQIATMESVPQAVIELKSEIISESRKSEDADNSFVMEQEDETEHRMSGAEVLDQEDRGALVQKIMEKKAEIEDGATGENGENEADEDKSLSMEKEKMRVLQEKMQGLTKSAYPLARLFDFANDDIESMVKELERWRSEQRRKEQEDQNRKAAGFGDSSRLYNIIASLQKEINAMKEELSKARGRVLNNDRRIQLFMANI